MNLREALETVSSKGAVNGNSLVSRNEETDRPWKYTPDTNSGTDVYHLTNEQLERVVLFAGSFNWEVVVSVAVEK